MKKIKGKSKYNNGLTVIAPLPESVVKWGECLLLHKRVPVITDEGIKYICKTCQGLKENADTKR